MVKTMPTAAVYTRRSNDQSGLRRSVERQATFCAELAERHGLDVVDTLEDDDLTAAGAAFRPSFERLLANLAGIDVIVAWESDRLYRSATDQERLYRAAEAAGTRVLTGRDEWADPALDSAWLSAGLGAVVGGQEARKAKRRTQDGINDAAAQGKPHGREAYGWRREYVTDDAGRWVLDGAGRRTFAREVIVEDEAAVIRWVVQRLLEGDSLRSLCADLNARKVTPPSASAWNPTKLRAMVLRRRNVGIRAHRAGGRKGRTAVETPGQWPAILDDATYERLAAHLNAPERKTNHGGAQPIHLLSGSPVECGVCGAPIRGSVTNTGAAKYRCSAPAQHVTRSRADCDEWITELVIQRLSMPDVDLRPKVDDAAEAKRVAEIATKQATLDNVADAVAAGTVDVTALVRVEARLRPELDALRAARMEDTGKPAALALAGADARERWPAASVDMRRAVIREMFESIRIMPTRRGTQTFDPASVAYAWRR